MAQRDNILQELRELQSSLVADSAQNSYFVPAGYFEGLIEQVLQRVKTLEREGGSDELADSAFLSNEISGKPTYTVPTGYFENLADNMLGRVKAIETDNVSEELNVLSPLLSSISKEMPYSVPAGYFRDLADQLTSTINAGSQSAEEELKAMSPLLSSLKKEVPFSVPSGYFDGIDLSRNPDVAKPQGKLISLTKQKWFRYAAAAVVISFVTLTGFFVFNRKKAIDPNDQSFAWVEKNLKKVSTDDIDNFVQSLDESLPVIASAEIRNDKNEINDVKELMKDIPDQEIQQFLEETQTLGSEDNIDDMFMN